MTTTKTVTYQKVDLHQLHFDPTNPRFHTGGAAPSEEKIQAILEKEPHVAKELVESFLANGYIDYEPLVVRKRTGGGYTVVEGNRRLAALRHIQNNLGVYQAKSVRLDDLRKIPVLLFPDSSGVQEQQEQRVYLGVRHLFGFRDWPAESKARFLDGQITSAETLKRTMRELNIKKSEIQRYLVPLRLRKYARTAWEPHKDQDFWYLGEGLNRTGIREYIELELDKDTLVVKSVNEAKLKMLFRHIYGTPEKDRADRVIEDTRQLSQLGRALADTKASAALEKGRTLEEASVLMESADDNQKRLRRLVNETGVVMGVLNKRAGSGHMVKTFESFKKAVKDFEKRG